MEQLKRRDGSVACFNSQSSLRCTGKTLPLVQALIILQLLAIQRYPSGSFLEKSIFYCKKS